MGYWFLRRILSILRFFQNHTLQDEAPTPVEAPPQAPQEPGNLIAQTVRSVLHNGDYRRHETLWRLHGFTIMPDYVSLPPPPGTEQFPDNPSASQSTAVFLPNLFLLGAAKAGTTTLYDYLRQSSTICMSKPKEPFFFEAEFHLGLEYYRKRYFPHWQGERLVGEARHRNLYLPYVPKRIAETNPLAKLLVVLRNPAERAYSHWWYWRVRGAEPLSFRDAIETDLRRIEAGYRLDTPEEIERYHHVLSKDGKGIYRTYLDSGYYFDQISRYTALFPPEQLKVILLEDLAQAPFRTLTDIELFLGLKPRSEVDFEAIHLNARPGGKQSTEAYGQIDADTLNWLIAHYQAHNDRLQTLLKRDLTHWNQFRRQ